MSVPMPTGYHSEVENLKSYETRTDTALEGKEGTLTARGASWRQGPIVWISCATENVVECLSPLSSARYERIQPSLSNKPHHKRLRDIRTYERDSPTFIERVGCVKIGPDRLTYHSYKISTRTQSESAYSPIHAT